MILDLCGGTGAWSRPYKEDGYDVRLITLPDYDVTQVEFGQHAMGFYRLDTHYSETTCIPVGDIYGILAAPPCTEFSVAKGSQPRDFAGAMTVVKACLEIIWHCRIHGNLKFWALENPVGFLRQFLGIPKYQFEQWQFGESRVKRTDIWGYFNEPVPTVKDKPHRLETNLGKRSHSQDWAKMEIPTEYHWLKEMPYNERRAALRAITPPGFAQAFYRANK